MVLTCILVKQDLNMGGRMNLLQNPFKERSLFLKVLNLFVTLVVSK